MTHDEWLKEAGIIEVDTSKTCYHCKEKLGSMIYKDIDGFYSCEKCNWEEYKSETDTSDGYEPIENREIA